MSFGDEYFPAVSTKAFLHKSFKGHPGKGGSIILSLISPFITFKL